MRKTVTGLDKFTCIYSNSICTTDRAHTKKERHRADTFDGCFNGWLMLRQVTGQNFKMIPSILAVREISPLEF